MEPPEDRCGFVCTPPEIFRGRDDVEVEETAFGWVIKKVDSVAPLPVDQYEWRPCSCCREVWQDGQCIWHADADNKPVKKLEDARAGHPERLDGAILRDVEFEDGFSFAGCGLRGATVDNVRLVEANFSDTSLEGAGFPDTSLDGANFSDASAVGTKFPDASLIGAEFPDADLRDAEFPNADLDGAKFPAADLFKAEFPDTSLIGAKFPDVYLREAEFQRTCLGETIFSESDLQGASFARAGAWDTDFTDTDLRNTEFHSTALYRANFEDADLRDADFSPEDRPTNLEDAVLEGADLRGTDFTCTRLFQADFKDVRLNAETEFDATQDDTVTTAYERDPDMRGWFRNEASAEQAAAWVHRRLQDLHEKNAMVEQARDHHVWKEEAHRADYWRQGQYFQWFVYTLNLGLTRHGENLKRVVYWSAGVILTCALAYPFLGGISNDEAVFEATALTDLSVGLFLRSLYFSTVTFSTLGYGDYHPVGEWAKALAGVESLAGALLVALFVFVLGRRVAR